MHPNYLKPYQILVKPKNYESYVKKKKTKNGETIKIIAQQPKTIDKTKTVDIKSVFIEHPKTSCKLPKTMKQAKKVGFGKNSDCSL